jgi:hypothetical protein
MECASGRRKPEGEWKMEWRLKLDNRATGLTVRPDDEWPGMWRIHYRGKVSDMVNLTRAKDAALSWIGGSAGGVSRRGINWNHIETR